jgi:hypothetical protein
MIDDQYIFSENKNLPVFLFMAVVVSIFMGMSVSAEEIFKDRKILERESFLNLSRISYLNSKIFFLFCLSGFQSLIFILIGSYILEIKGLLFEYWIILFTTSCFANMLGLNISSALNSIITIYILIPFILVPQLLLGGAMLRFDDLHPAFTNKKYVPLIGDLMVSRWSYEALAVSQFKHNEYQKYFFEIEQELSESSFQSSYVVPRLTEITRGLMEVEDVNKYPSRFNQVRNQLEFISTHYDVQPFPLISSLTPDYFNEPIGDRLILYLENLNTLFKSRYNESVKQKDSIYYALVDSIGRDGFNKLKRDHYNEQLSDIMKNRNQIKKLYESRDLLIQKEDPIYTIPYSNYGRAHFYAPVKVIGSYKFDTVWFNITIMWILSVFLYFILVKDYLKKLLVTLSGKTLNKKKRKFLRV